MTETGARGLGQSRSKAKEGPGALDLRCYVITSGHGRHVVATAAAAAAGGAGISTLR